MKTLKRKQLLVLVFFSISITSYAQEPANFPDNLTKEIATNLQTRILLVEESQIQEKSFASQVSNHWSLNKVEVKTKEEIMELKNSSPEKYAIIYQSIKDFYFPHIVYSRLESEIPDLRILTPVMPGTTQYVGFNTHDSYFTLQIMQQVLSGRSKNSKKTGFDKILIESDQNCGRLEKSHLLVDKKYLPKKSAGISNIPAYPYTHELLSTEEISSRMENGNEAIIKVFPLYYFTGTDGRLMGNYMQVIMQNNGSIISAIKKTAKIPIMEPAQREFRPKDIKKHTKC